MRSSAGQITNLAGLQATSSSRCCGSILPVNGKLVNLEIQKRRGITFLIRSTNQTRRANVLLPLSIIFQFYTIEFDLKPGFASGAAAGLSTQPSGKTGYLLSYQLR